MPAEPVRRETPHKPLSASERAELLRKREARTLTPEEYERLEWDQRMGARRKRGVSNFWREERARLKAGQPGTRAWNDEQRAAILRGDTPKGPDGRPMEGHHRYNVADYPQKAAEPGHIAPATPKEHLEKWHGGNFQNDTSGEPLDPDYEDEF